MNHVCTPYRITSIADAKEGLERYICAGPDSCGRDWTVPDGRTEDERNVLVAVAECRLNALREVMS